MSTRHRVPHDMRERIQRLDPKTAVLEFVQHPCPWAEGVSWDNLANSLDISIDEMLDYLREGGTRQGMLDIWEAAHPGMVAEGQRLAGQWFWDIRRRIQELPASEVVRVCYYDQRAFHREGSVHEICEALDIGWKDVHQWVGWSPAHNTGETYNLSVLSDCFVDVWAETNPESRLYDELAGLVKDYLRRFYDNIPQTRTSSHHFARAIKLRPWDGELDEIVEKEYGVAVGANNTWGVKNLRTLRERIFAQQ